MGSSSISQHHNNFRIDYEMNELGGFSMSKKKYQKPWLLLQPWSNKYRITIRSIERMEILSQPK